MKSSYKFIFIIFFWVSSCHFCLGVLNKWIEWPIEVFGVERGQERVYFVNNRNIQVSGIYLKTHNVSYDGKMSFRINRNDWIKVTNDKVNFSRMDDITGGFGGGHSVHYFYIEIPNLKIYRGANIIEFRYKANATDKSSGYRVLDFYFDGPSGRIPDGKTYLDHKLDKGYEIIHNTPEEIEQGEQLWKHQDLIDIGAFPDGRVIKAKCSDCHTEDGRDLQYFNYSNKSIITRSKYHGLSQYQGELIASYIRTLPYKSKYGRPWNSPYQPAPDLDSRGVDEWAAGGGEQWVLDDFSDMYDFLYPEALVNGEIEKSLITGNQMSIDGYINMRQIPIPFQLPDWNSWLPIVHPKDATGRFFEQHPANLYYEYLKNKQTGYTHEDWFFFQNHVSNYTKIDDWPNYPATGSHNLSATERHSLETYSAALWGLVKSWEIMQSYNLESQAKNYFSNLSLIAEGPSWYTNMPFFVSPNMLGLPLRNHGLRNNTKQNRFFFSYIWYHLQGVLYSGQGIGSPITPVDWRYTYGFLQNMPFGLHNTNYDSNPFPLMYLWVSKAAQLMDNGVLPNNSFDNSPKFDIIHPRYLTGAPSIEHFYYDDLDMYKITMKNHTYNWLRFLLKFTKKELARDPFFNYRPFKEYPKDLAGINNLYYSQDFYRQFFYLGYFFNKIGMRDVTRALQIYITTKYWRDYDLPYRYFGDSNNK